MWNLDGRRWEWWRRGGGRLSIWNGSIHLPFLLVSKCVQWKGKARWGKLISKKRNHFIADHTVKHISPLGLVQAAYPKLLVILFISEGMNVCGFTLLLLVVFVKGILIHFKSHFHLLHPVSLENTWTSFTSFFFLPISQVSSSLVGMSVCQWRELLLKESIVQVCVVNGDEAIARIRWTTGSFHRAPALSRSFSNRLDSLEKTPRWAMPRSVAPVSLNTGHGLAPGEKV